MSSLVTIIAAVLQVLAAMMGEIIKRKQEAENAASREAIMRHPAAEFKRRYGMQRDLQAGVPATGNTEATTPDPGKPDGNT